MNSHKDVTLKNLILGIIDNYNYHDISIFLLSLDSVKYCGHICLFAGPSISQSTANQIRKHGVEIIRYKKSFPFIDDPHPDNFDTLPQPIHIYNFRHYLYYNYLMTNQGKFKNVLITDVRDVVFQKDPFDFRIEEEIYVAVENITKNIEQNACTAKWISKGYDSEMLAFLKEKEVICAGTTIAPMHLMTSYLKRLIEEFFHVKDAYKCADQAMHNVLIHTHQIQICKCYNFNGPFLTLDTQENYFLNKERELINWNGDVVPIVHQYDRHAELVRIFIHKHKASAFWLINYPKLKRTFKRIERRFDYCKKNTKLRRGFLGLH